MTRCILRFLTMDGFMYKSKIIGLLFLKDTNAAFPLYVTNKAIICSRCNKVIPPRDTFTRDANYRREMCKMCRPLVGEKYMKSRSQTMQAFRTAVEMQRMKPTSIQTSSVSECKAIMFAAGYEIFSALITETNAVKMLSPIRIVYFRLASIKSPLAIRLRELANTFLPEKI